MFASIPDRCVTGGKQSNCLQIGRCNSDTARPTDRCAQVSRESRPSQVDMPAVVMSVFVGTDIDRMFNQTGFLFEHRLMAMTETLWLEGSHGVILHLVELKLTSLHP